MIKTRSIPIVDIALLTKELHGTQSEYGSSLKDFRIICELGRGAYGVAYQVQSLKQTDSTFVLKKIPIKHLKPKQQRDALGEVQILRKLTHPHIIRYYTSFIEDDALFILMEYAAGGDLYNFIRKQREKGKYLPEMEVWKYAYQIALGLEYLHYHNIIHRDIKCLNIFLTDTNSIKIGDLGVSRVTKRTTRLQGTKVGTPLYLSPELIRQQPYDFKIDIWAFGCVVYYLASLEPPFIGGNFTTLGESIVSKQPKLLPKVYSNTLQKFVDKLLMKNPADRPTTKEVLKMFPVFVKKAFENSVKKVSSPEPLTNLGRSQSIAAFATCEFIQSKNNEMNEEVIQPESNIRPSTVNPASVQCWTKEPVIHQIEPVEKASETAEQFQEEKSKNMATGPLTRTTSRKIIICPDSSRRATTASHKSRLTLTLLKSLQGGRTSAIENPVEPYRPISAGFGALQLFQANNLQRAQRNEEILENNRPQTAVQSPFSIPIPILPRIRPLKACLCKINNLADSNRKSPSEQVCGQNNAAVIIKKNLINDKGVFRTGYKKLTISDL